MTLYTYIVVHDSGFAPNPFFGYCTLACCKPEIRKRAHEDDWIVGLTPKAQGNKVVYFMRVDEITDFASYWNDPRFEAKKPSGRSLRFMRGDNIYEPLPEGDFRQLRSSHSETEKDRDLKSKRVLISETFGYFGSVAIALPPQFTALIVGRG
jgi:hypothetical protein